MMKCVFCGQDTSIILNGSIPLAICGVDIWLTGSLEDSRELCKTSDGFSQLARKRRRRIRKLSGKPSVEFDNMLHENINHYCLINRYNSNEALVMYNRIFVRTPSFKMVESMYKVDAEIEIISNSTYPVEEVTP